MYQFQNAEICPQAKLAFEDFPTDVHEAIEYVKAARHIDQALGILKKGYAIGVISEHEHDEFLTHIEDAEELLESLGVLEDHEYIRDDLEPRASELLDVESVDVSDEAAEFEDEDRWLFSSEDSGMAYDD